MQTQVFHIVTFGCQMNINDSGWLSRALTARGFTEGSLDSASIVIVNTCSVREKPELKVRSMLGRIRQETGNNPGVIVAVIGCVAQQLGAELFSYSSQVRLVSGPDGLSRIPDTIEDLQSSPAKKISLLDFTEHYEERPETGRGPASPTAFVNIMQGCDNFCTYCIVPYTRGRQKSRSSAAILDECRTLVDRGCLEITLLGQNVNAFGLDKSGDGTSFASLLRQVSAIPGLKRLRYVSPHPKDMTEEDVELFGTLENLCPRLHLPMQAGSDRILRRMNRRYDSAAFLRLVENLHRARPDIALSSDLIVGFPGETEEDFQDTLSMIRRVNFVASYSFCYSPRPGTRAALFPDKIDKQTKTDRLERLQALQEELGVRWLKGRVGSTTEVLLEQPSPRQDVDGLGSWQGRDPYGALIHVALPAGRDYTGRLLRVSITGAKKHSLTGSPLADGGNLQ